MGKAVRKPRKAQTHTATGRQAAIASALVLKYPAWPDSLVDLPRQGKERQRALGWFDLLLQHRSPEAWQPADAARVALLARSFVAWESMLHRIATGRAPPGAMGWADKLGATVGRLARQLGLATAIADPRSLANEAQARRDEKETLDPRADPLSLFATPAGQAVLKN